MPGGPLQGLSLQGELGYALTNAPGEVIDTALDGSKTRYEASEVAFSPFPTRIGARLGVIDWVDVAVDYSWLDVGAEVRIGVPEWSPPLPMALSLSHRTTDFGVIVGDLDHREWRLRAEAYPPLVIGNTERSFWVTALGMSTGQSAHSYFAEHEFGLLRDETRLEAALGAELRNHRAVVALIAVPHVVVDSDRTYDLAGERALELRQSFGLTVFLKLGVAFTFHDRHEVAGSQGDPFALAGGVE
jgi:hypothetical protein